jgi:hypothetical protein
MDKAIDGHTRLCSEDMKEHHSPVEKVSYRLNISQSLLTRIGTRTACRRSDYEREGAAIRANVVTTARDSGGFAFSFRTTE